MPVVPLIDPELQVVLRRLLLLFSACLAAHERVQCGILLKVLPKYTEYWSNTTIFPHWHLHYEIWLKTDTSFQVLDISNITKQGLLAQRPNSY